MSRGKEIKLNISDNYNTIVGTVDTNIPKSIFLSISAWGSPLKDDKFDYNKIINWLTKSIKLNIIKYNNSGIFKEHQIIVDFDMRESGIMFGKRSYMCCEITLFQNNDSLLPITSEVLLKHSSNIIKNIINDILDSNIYFKFHRTKK